jgi:hypothetical protein
MMSEETRSLIRMVVLVLILIFASATIWLLTLYAAGIIWK